MVQEEAEPDSETWCQNHFPPCKPASTSTLRNNLRFIGAYWLNVGRPEILNSLMIFYESVLMCFMYTRDITFHVKKNVDRSFTWINETPKVLMLISVIIPL